MKASDVLPILRWLPGYHRQAMGQDLLAAALVTFLVIPQSLAYGLLAGVPAYIGLYASILPPLIYAIFGTSRTLAVGPVAIIALMTSAALTPLFPQGSPEYLTAAVVLSLISGLMLVLMGALRLGFLANFLSHPVVSAFVTASAIVIILNQLRHLLGITASGSNLFELLPPLFAQLDRVHLPTLMIGLATMGFLIVTRRHLRPILQGFGLPASRATLLARLAPIVALGVSILANWFWRLDQQGVAVVGQIPSQLPGLSWPEFDLSLWRELAVSALLISLVGFVESVSIGQTLAARQRERIDANQELVALGGANLGAAFSSGIPVSGGFSRTAVNDDAGARTPIAGIYTAIGIAVVTLLLTAVLAYLPLATLAAAIIVAAGSLVDWKTFWQTRRYSLGDFGAMIATLAMTLGHSVEAGIIAGVGLSIGLFLYRTSRPHCAIVGRVPGTEHFRNVKRHEVETTDHVALLRVDESLYFANARFLEDRVLALVAERPKMTDVVLVCAAVNHIDASALESLEMLDHRLGEAGVRLHFAEIKGPVMDRLRDTVLLENLRGEVHLSTYAAWTFLRPSSANP